MRNKKDSFSAAVKAEIRGLPADDEENRAFVQRCFLSGGTVSDPNRSYHLEFSLEFFVAEKLVRILRGFGLNPKQTMRRGLESVYVKEAGEIADILNIMTAHKSLLRFESIRVEKELRNHLNRKVNCETANLNKTVAAALGQIETIRFILENTGPGYLDKSLEEVAQLRLTHENASLEEIGAMLEPPIGKSGVNHRLRKIHIIATELARE
ncbi:MAG: DNA-binding protein WhiA [Defluviitaleaceae bacterium]|nr:DNA-binding protein WhiA [Defluviitaleaceae bacterium]MCL2239019.1 DNA-binding protein WhiA [Defluviitaleaceae bacterium]